LLITSVPVSARYLYVDLSGKEPLFHSRSSLCVHLHVEKGAVKLYKPCLDISRGLENSNSKSDMSAGDDKFRDLCTQ
jgi:hypothetical protein